MTGRSEILYKVVEVSPVTEKSLEGTLNQRAADGWGFDSIHFVMREGSHRPSMAYLFFRRSRGEGSGHAPES